MSVGDIQEAGNGDWSTWRRLVLQGIEDLKTEQRDLSRRVDSNRDNMVRKLNELDLELKLFKTKIAVLAGVISAVVSVALPILLKFL